MAGNQHQVVPIIMPGTPAAGQLFQTDAGNKLVAIDTSGAAEGWVLARNASGLWEPRVIGAVSATGLKFSIGFPFSAAGEVFELPIGRFGAIVKAWAARLSASGNASWAIASSPNITGTYTDMVGGGVGPGVASAIGVLDTSVTDWTDQTLAADEILKVTCSTLSVAQAMLTLHFERT